MVFYLQKNLHMDTKTIISLTKKAKQKLQEQMFVQKIFIFGSQATKNSKPWSDIDIAIISNELGKDYWEEEKKVNKIVKQVNDKFEAHVFNPEDFSNPYDPLANEIKKYGIHV